MAGNIILLNGASSSGKTSLAHALQDVLDGLYIHTGLDHFLERVPRRFHAISDGLEGANADGLVWIMPTGRPPVTELRFGPAWSRLIAGMYAAVAGLASAGNDVIVDDVIMDAVFLREASTALEGHPVLFVGVRCPLGVLQERERLRGDRYLGLAEVQHEIVHAHGVYDVEVDTSVDTAAACAHAIKERMLAGPPTAFDRLRRAL